MNTWEMLYTVIHTYGGPFFFFFERSGGWGKVRRDAYNTTNNNTRILRTRGYTAHYIDGRLGRCWYSRPRGPSLCNIMQAKRV